MRGFIMNPPDSLSLEAVLDEPLRFACELSVSTRSIDRQPLVSLSPLGLSGEIARIEGGYALSGHLVYDGELECSRCLAAYPFHEDELFSLALYRRKREAGAEIELDQADLDVFWYDEPVIRLSPIAEERVQIALPMKPLCRPDCRGLCVSCGQDLNLGACTCSRETVDPRWEALRALKEKV
ncbi:MAG TPA: DUF177 domain-containing protein [Thermoanaerobaculia bacterium]|jgi:uncharacterized protein